MGNQLSCLPSSNMKKNDDQIFPVEVIIEILTYMPLKSLAQFKLVCKEWQSIIHDHYFIEKHMNRGKAVHHWHNIIPPTDANPDRFRYTYFHGLDGLLLIKIINTQKTCIWNPATRRVLELPDPHYDRSYGFAFSYIPATKNYRIVSLYKDKESGRECCEVFTPGHSHSWRRLTFPDNLNWPVEGKTVSVIQSGGAVHCLLSDLTSHDQIVSFDIGTESFTLNYVPKSRFEADWTKVCALDWDGKLGFADIKGENLEVMVLEDYKRQRWSRNKKVIHLPFMKKYGYDKSSKLVTLFAKGGDIWFWLEGEKIFSYTIETGQISGVNGTQAFAVKHKVYPYKPSLVSFEGMQPEDPRLQTVRPKILLN